MKTFVEHIAEQENLEESLLRTGSIAAYGARARKEGEDSVRAFKRGQQALRKGGPEVSIEGRVRRIENALDLLFDGLVAQRLQIGAGVAVDVVGHSLTAKDRKKR